MVILMAFMEPLTVVRVSRIKSFELVMLRRCACLKMFKCLEEHSMENKFKNISKVIYSHLKKDELLTLSFTGEESQFIRLNNAKIRQTGLVNDADIHMKMIANGRTCTGSFTLSGNDDIDNKRAGLEIERMRLESTQILEDPYLIIPEGSGSSREIKNSNGLKFKDAVDAILPVIQGVDFVGILSNGKMYRGNSNSLGQELSLIHI